MTASSRSPFSKLSTPAYTTMDVTYLYLAEGESAIRLAGDNAVCFTLSSSFITH